VAAADLAPRADGTDQAALAEPGQRGSLTVADKAITTIARAAVLSAQGVAPTQATTGVISGAVSGALGRDLPRIDVNRAGTQVDVDIEVASVWPRPAAGVADAVRSAVSTQLSSLAALQTGAVSVVVVKVVRASTDSGQRRRVQ
jgi:uncharacterized alkaline shock family protein YloU